MTDYCLDRFFGFMEESKIGEVFAFQVLPDGREILHFLSDDSDPAPGVAELKFALDNIRDMLL
jgi:hypothetical protein